MAGLNNKYHFMIIVKTDYFSTRERLARFINENNIKRGDILSITADHGGTYSIFFYADDSVKEITHGLFD